MGKDVETLWRTWLTSDPEVGAADLIQRSMPEGLLIRDDRGQALDIYAFSEQILVAVMPDPVWPGSVLSLDVVWDKATHRWQAEVKALKGLPGGRIGVVLGFPNQATSFWRRLFASSAA